MNPMSPEEAEDMGWNDRFAMEEEERRSGKEQVDRETAAAARKAAKTFLELARAAIYRGEFIEFDRQLEQATWHLDLADRLESKYGDEE